MSQMLSATDQSPRHVRAFFENENGFVLRFVSARCALSELFRFELELLHGDIRNPIDPATVIGLGATVQVELPEEDAKQEYYGVISQLRQIGWSERGITYRATMVPGLWFLTQKNNCRIFQNMKTQEIVEQVLKDSGISDFEFKLSADYAQHEYCVQYRETDFNFVSRLLEEEGIFYYFKHENSKHTLVMSDSVIGYNDMENAKVHFPRPGQSFPNRQEFLTWEEDFQFIPGSFSQKDYNFTEPGTNLYRKRPTILNIPNSESCEFYDYHGRYMDGNNGVHLTDVRMGEAETKYQTGHATSQIAGMHPGSKFIFGTHCIEARRGAEFVTTSVEFQARASDYLTGSDFEEDEFYRNFITSIPSDRVFRPARRAERPVIRGAQTAIVTTDGDEVMVDEHGRVKVHFHWDRYNGFDQNSSCWVRVSQVHAGEGFGMMDIPRRNEEVIVSFIEGDPDRPIITGRVYNGSNRPPFDLGPENNATNKTRRGNATKSIGKTPTSYNEMTMDDTPGKEQIRIHSQYNMDSTVQNDQTVTVNNNRTKTIATNETNSIGVDQSEDVGNNRTTNIGINDSETVGINQSISVGVKQSTSVGSIQTNNVGMIHNEMIGIAGNQMIGVAKAVTVGVVQNQATGLLSFEQVGLKKSTIVGSEYKISAGSKFEIACGASKIIMDSSGKITIEAPAEMIINGGGATIKMKGGIIDLN